MIDHHELAYSMFNQYLFQEAKNNIEHLEYYFQTNPNTASNKLISELVYAVKTYDLPSVDLPLFNGIFTKIGKTNAESRKILDGIVKWKNYTKEQVIPAKKTIQDICANSVIRRAKQLHDKSPSDYLKYLKNASFKTSDADVLTTIGFNELDIHSIVAEGPNDGIPSHYEWINEAFPPTNRIEKSQMIMISMPPGCFTGDTKVLLSSGELITLKELYDQAKKEIPVMSFDIRRPEFKYSTAEECILTKHVNELFEVKFETGSVKATDDHKFLLVSGKYKQAKDLVIGDLIRSVNFEAFDPEDVQEVIGIDHLKFESPEPVYDIINVKKYSNFTIMLNEMNGIVVHNCGKSLFAMSEALYMAARGHKVHYLAMGDLNMKDFVIRMGTMWSGLSFANARLDITNIYNEITKTVGNNLSVTIVPAGSITVTDYIEFIKDQDHDVLFVDYDSNFKSAGSDNMYSEYGEIYEKLTELTGIGKIVYILAQPKVGVWNNERIELQDVGESSRKQHTADIIITRGRADSPNHLGMFKIVKNRRGELATAYSIRLPNGRFRVVPKSIYESLKMETEKKSYTDADIDAKISMYNQCRGQARSYMDGGEAPKGIQTPPQLQDEYVPPPISKGGMPF